MRYQTKPVEVEAMQWDGSVETIPEVVSWMLPKSGVLATNTSGSMLLLDTARQALSLEPNHWLIWLADGFTTPSFKVMDNVNFKQRHEELNNA